jgi:hypothetical protein
MSELERRRSRLPRSTRERRAYRLVVSGGALAMVALVGVVLAIAGVIGAEIPVLAAALAVVCAVLFRRTVSG